MFDKCLGYDSLNTTRSALSSLGLNFEDLRKGRHPLFIRYIKAVFILRSPKPCNTHLWDVNIVLQYLKKASFIERFDT